jgi:SAM-dependent methyltransferase
MITRIKSIIKRQQFLPGFLGIFVNPSYFNRKYVACAVRKYAPQITGKMLDYGCGSKPYKSMFTNVTQYVGVDIDENPGHDHKNENIDVFYDGMHLPFADNEFDAVLSSQVLEHVPSIHNSLKEIYRVLKPGGQVLLSLPFVYPEHEVPNDYRRLTVYGIKQVMEECGFEITSVEKLGSTFEVMIQLTMLYIYKLCISGLCKGVNLITRTIFLSPFCLIGIVGGRLFRKQQSLYLDICVLAQKPISN